MDHHFFECLCKPDSVTTASCNFIPWFCLNCEPVASGRADPVTDIDVCPLFHCDVSCVVQLCVSQQAGGFNLALCAIITMQICLVLCSDHACSCSLFADVMTFGMNIVHNKSGLAKNTARHPQHTGKDVIFVFFSVKPTWITFRSDTP